MLNFFTVLCKYTASSVYIFHIDGHCGVFQPFYTNYWYFHQFFSVQICKTLDGWRHKTMWTDHLFNIEMEFSFHCICSAIG